MNIRSRLLWLVVAVWVPAAVAIGAVARTTYLKESQAARDRIRDLAHSVAAMVERELDKRVVTAATLSASSALRDGDLARFYEEAASATRGTDNWVFLVTRDRQVLNTTLPFQPGMAIPRLPDSPWLDQGSAVFFTQRGPVVKRPVVAVFTPQMNVAPPRYNVGVSFDPAVIQGILNQQRLPHGSLAAVMDRGLRIMARSRNPEKWVGTEATGTMRQRAIAGEVGFAPSVTLDKVPSLSYLSPPNHYGWAVVVAVPNASLDAWAREATVRGLSLAAVLLALSLLLALYAARRISQPVLALKEAAAELGEERVPPALRTGLAETDEVAQALHHAGLRAVEASATLQARVEEAVLQAERAQARLFDAQKHEAIGRLTGGIAHDFNNLLQTISTALQVVLRSVPLEGPQRRVVEAATRATGKAADLVRQMLTFGRAQPLQPQAIDLNDFILQSSELTGRAAGGKVALSADVAPGLPAVFADPTQLELALLNLVFNARDAMPGGGRIALRARLAEPAEMSTDAAHPPFVCVEVADDGPGMDAATRDKAFEPYFTTKPVGAGSGLGLAQVLAFARQSGGDARIHSAPGKGTQVRIYLPATREPVSAAEAFDGESTPTAPSLRSLRVLMVEDDPLLSSVVAPALRAAGHEVTLCRQADDAIALLTQTPAAPFDVLFSDVVMPGAMNGFDLARWCRANLATLPVVLATGYTAHTPDRDVSLLRKPYAMDELLAALDAAAGNATGNLQGG